MSLSTTILLVLALYFAQLFLQETSRYKCDLGGIVGNRDQPPEPSIVAARLNRAKNNMLEALPIFLGLAFLALVRGSHSVMVERAASIFLFARVAYVPAYVSGVPWLRSLTWLASVASLAVMAGALVQAG
jgi:uncharacterized MAPEG superfamily protein